MSERAVQRGDLLSTNHGTESRRAHHDTRTHQQEEARQVGNPARTSALLVASGSKALSDNLSNHATNGTASSSSLSHSRAIPQSHPCRWAWCRLTFDTNPMLVHHVIHDHVRSAVPVRRDEIAIYQRVEEGIGESLTLSGFGLSAPINETSNASKSRAEENFAEAAPMSSLPSPPASSPTPLSFAEERRYPTGAASPSYAAYMPSSEAPRHISPPLNLTNDTEDSSIPGARQTPPTFASLSSPVEPAFIFDDPPTPTFDSLVESAIGANRSQPDANLKQPSPSPQYLNDGTEDSQNSSTSSSSYESVEKHLTQSMDVDDHTTMYPNAKPVWLQEPTLDSTASGVVSNQTSSQATPVRVKQAWYGTRPARSIASPALGKKFSPRTHSASTQSSKDDTRVETRSGHPFRSGTLQITPAASPSMANGRHATYAQQSQSQSSTQSGSQTHDSSLEYVSYPPLQTQAPYQSQTLKSDMDASANVEPSASRSAVAKRGSELLLVVFVHGFKGTDQTFGDFPERLQHILAETTAGFEVECILFPAYETKGDLNEAVVHFADWLTTLTVQKEVASGGGAGKANIVLCGHSMGGLLIADTLLEFHNTRPDKTCPLWPKIIACIAFDTPYLGLHPNIVKHSVTKASEYASAAHKVGSAVFGAFAGLGAKQATAPTTPAATPSAPTSGPAWAKWAAPAAYAVGGAILAGAAAGSAYYKREELNVGFTWAADHMKYVGNLWDEAALKRRIEALIEMDERAGVTSRTFYALIPATPPFSAARTFIVLPKRDTRQFAYFLPASNSLAPDELQAHTGMFGAKTNDGYYELGLAAAKIIRESLHSAVGSSSESTKQS
ncbi:putative serine esterase (DUF676) [Lyophyllum shimeji]|uniref:Serine esterase (DUF676) n=1 Tax=Lyophyllum shimeji TaxID=47721 RepID=A0A9P3UHH1_LYOSH|nr:putative serine esterase (DUF676) [Lyophyllum shimeji]